jgi:putative CocE/NonD family hydrolase
MSTKHSMSCAARPHDEQRQFARGMTGFLTALAVTMAAHSLAQAADFPPEIATRHAAALAYIAEHADREDMVMTPMRDGVRLYSLILFPKDQPRRNLPAVLIHNPYLTKGMVDRFGEFVASFLKHGYAVVFQNERGRYYSEGTFTYLAGSSTDGYDTIQALTSQPWSNGKVATLGCSSSAEEQHRINASHPPGLAAAVPMGSGAGIGKVGPYNEQGNWFRGGAVQMWWYSWYFKSAYTYKPSFPRNLSRDQMLTLSKLWDMDEHIPPSEVTVDNVVWTLPIMNITSRLGAAPSDWDDFIRRQPNDPRWKKVDFGGEGDRNSAPALYINSWYDLSIGPNVAMFQYQTGSAATQVARDNTFMVIAPTPHCEQGRIETEHTMTGERDVGDARFDYVGLVQGWYDHFLKGEGNGITKQPKVRAYMMGANEWRSYDTWPPKQVQYVPFYLASDSKANSAMGDGRLSTTKPGGEGSDAFSYDPLHPVPSLGGSICCFSQSFTGGSYDQSHIEMRNDILVYTSEPLQKTLELAGPVSVSLFLSSDRKDTDLTIKLLDVYPDGRAYNLDENIERVRWRDGWDEPVFMEPDKVYKVDIGPLQTSNAFLPGHRIRVEISSSNFPRFDRNLNTGGNNYDEKDPLVSHNVIHHSARYSSVVILPVVNGSGAPLFAASRRP